MWLQINSRIHVINGFGTRIGNAYFSGGMFYKYLLYTNMYNILVCNVY